MPGISIGGVSNSRRVASRGALDDLTSLGPVQCSTGGATFASVVPPAGDAFFLVVPNNGAFEGSYGRDHAGSERDVSQFACYPQLLAGCP